MLFAYMACFSFAYDWLDAATGALILFGAVQVTMFAAGLRGRERLSASAWAGGMARSMLWRTSKPCRSAPTIEAAAGDADRTDELGGGGGFFLCKLPLLLLLKHSLPDHVIGFVSS